MSVAKELEVPIFNTEPATHASLWRTYANPQALWSKGQEETREGELDQLVQEECEDWIFRLIKEGAESNPTGVCLRPSSSEFVQGSSGALAES